MLGVGSGAQAQGFYKHWGHSPHKRAHRICTIAVQGDTSRQPPMIPKLPFDAYVLQSLFILRLFVRELLSSATMTPLVSLILS